jgi:hypothetical protein
MPRSRQIRRLFQRFVRINGHTFSVLKRKSMISLCIHYRVSAIYDRIEHLHILDLQGISQNDPVLSGSLIVLRITKSLKCSRIRKFHGMIGSAQTQIKELPFTKGSPPRNIGLPAPTVGAIFECFDKPGQTRNLCGRSDRTWARGKARG